MLPGRQWLESQTSNGSTVLLLDRSGCCNGELASTIRQVSFAPRLCILDRDVTLASCTVLSHCMDFLTWPCPDQELYLRLQRVGIDNGFKTKCETADTALAELRAFNIIGRSERFVDIALSIKRYASCDPPILLEGATGTGKEIVARAFHYLGRRRNCPFIPVNCGAIPDDLIENELFGHERGAYTDARDSHPGLVTQADGGTLYLDEIESLSAKGQVALLRFLQDSTYKPLGSRHLRSADTRVIAATKDDLHDLVEQRLFRQDLLFRLNMIRIVLPPLCERRDDIDLLADYFIVKYCAKYELSPRKLLHPGLLQWMQSHDWPGNVRELENYIHRAVLTTDGEVIHQQGAAVSANQETPVATLPFNQAKATAITRFERDYLVRLMTETRGNVTEAARQAGKERRSLGKLLKKHGIRRERFVSN
jgi:DNA-binding NtrC family response regulator